MRRSAVGRTGCSIYGTTLGYIAGDECPHVLDTHALSHALAAILSHPIRHELRYLSIFESAPAKVLSNGREQKRSAIWSGSLRKLGRLDECRQLIIERLQKFEELDAMLQSLSWLNAREFVTVKPCRRTELLLPVVVPFRQACVICLESQG